MPPAAAIHVLCATNPRQYRLYFGPLNLLACSSAALQEKGRVEARA
jgi:hypothetical protein